MNSACVIVVSDTAFVEKSLDQTGPKLVDLLESDKVFQVSEIIIVPDVLEDIQNAVKAAVDSNKLVITCGGTGFSPRDVTPEALKPLFQKDAPGLVIAMMQSSLLKTPLAALSRPVAGVIRNSLCISLPGSVKGATENLSSILQILKHACDLLNDNKEANDFHETLNGPRCRCGNTRIVENLTERPRQSPFELVSYQDAVESVVKQASMFTKQETISLIQHINSKDISGLVVAQDVYSPGNVPMFNASIVDGYAIKSINGIGEYSVIGSVTAGISTQLGLSSSSNNVAVRITTGSPVPNGFDSVVMVEDTLLLASKNGEEEKIKVLETVNVNENIRLVGSDLKKGEQILNQGSVVDLIGGALGTLISCGIRQLEVFKRPKISIMSTGNEILDLVEELPLNQVYDINRPCLKSILTRLNLDVSDVGIIKDDPVLLKSKIESVLNSDSDILVTTGGVSMGEHDYIKPILKELNAEIHFGRVFLKPGKPTCFAVIPREKCAPLMFFGLPGNPVSAVVTLHLFVIPCIRALSGYQNPYWPIIKVALEHDIPLDERPEFQRAQVTVFDSNKGVGLKARTRGNQRSSRIASVSGCNALIQAPSSKTVDKSILEKGSIVDAILIGPL